MTTTAVSDSAFDRVVERFKNLAARVMVPIEWAPAEAYVVRRRRFGDSTSCRGDVRPVLPAWVYEALDIAEPGSVPSLRRGPDNPPSWPGTGARIYPDGSNEFGDSLLKPGWSRRDDLLHLWEMSW